MRILCVRVEFEQAANVVTRASTAVLVLSGLAPESNTSEVYESVLKEVEALHGEYSGKQQAYNSRIVRLNERVIESDEAAMALKNAFKGINKKAGHAGKIESKWLL